MQQPSAVALPVQAGQIYRFKKSGNLVRTLSSKATPEGVEWVVERTQGQSAGKQMLVFERALEAPDAQVLS